MNIREVIRALEIIAQRHGQEAEVQVHGKAITTISVGTPGHPPKVQIEHAA